MSKEPPRHTQFTNRMRPTCVGAIFRQVVRVIVRAIILSSFAEERNQNLKIDSTFLRAKNLFASQFVADVQKQIAVGANNPRQEKRFASANLCVCQEQLPAGTSRGVKP